MPSRIPEARQKLEKLLNNLRNGSITTPPLVMAHIEEILPLLHRDRAARRAPGVKVEVTEELRRRVLNLVDADPDSTMQEIANRVGLRHGARVSEIVNGLR